MSIQFGDILLLVFKLLPMSIGTVLLVGLGIFSFNKYFNKKTESNINSKFNELEHLMNNQSFLYGNLNSIKSYVLSRSPMEAAQYLTELMNLMKSLSNHSKQKNISLAQEIDMILLYLELEKKRLGEQLEYYKDIDTNLKTDKIQVKPLVFFKKIEEFIENQHPKSKIKFNLLVRQSGERLNCHIEDNQFIIEIPISPQRSFLTL
jgi:LytS/YehU family sensor histidine kinase